MLPQDVDPYNYGVAKGFGAAKQRKAEILAEAIEAKAKGRTVKNHRPRFGGAFVFQRAVAVAQPNRTTWLLR